MKTSRLSSRRAMTGVEILLVVAGVAALIAWVKPSLLPGASKRAATGTAATAALVAATDAPAAVAAASVAKIAEANAAAPASPARDFISQEAPLALTLLPSPDPTALLEAERRRSAVMEGRLDEARRRYESATKESADLRRERDEALAARQAADLAIEQAAAAEHARTMQAICLGILALIAGGAWLYTLISRISPATLGKVAADIRAGANPISAMNERLAPRLHDLVRRAAQLATEPKDA